jgi:peptidoglycan/LPS O-acetylase OafA/YrhL
MTGDHVGGSRGATRVSRLAGIDTLRGLAAAAVFVCHSAQYWSFLAIPHVLSRVMSWGAQGVDVFIVISGFCLMMPVVFSHGRLNTGQFYGRRAWRILPAYWVALAIASVLAVLPATWALVVAAPATFADVLIHVVGMQTWVPSTLGTINGSLWSVSLEIQLYIVFPLLILLWRRLGIWWLLVIALALAVAWGLLGGVDALSAYVGDPHALPARLIQFTMGMGCAVWVTRGRPPRARTSALAAALFGALAVTALTFHAFGAVQLVLWGACGASLVMLISVRGQSGHVVTQLEAFGARSYSFYLLHQPALLLFAPIVAMIPGRWIAPLIVGGLVCFAVTTLAAMVLFRYVELPSHRAGRRRFPNVTPRVSPTEAVES